MVATTHRGQGCEPSTSCMGSTTRSSRARRISQSACGKMHSHAQAQLICATTTPMEVVAGGRQWTVQPGRAAWLPGGVGHSISGPGEPCVFRSLYIRPDVATRLSGQAGVLGLSPLLTELFLRMIEIYEGGDAAMYPHLTALVLDEIRGPNRDRK
jgi:hypothetical protein